MSTQKRITQGDYLKAIKPFKQYISKTDIKVKANNYIILHFDGVGMTKKHLSRMNQNDKKVFSECLLQTAKSLCEFFKSTCIAYACNDEISLLLEAQDIFNNYRNRIQKLVSIAAAKASIELLQQLLQNESIVALKEMQPSCLFAVKCYNLPQNLVDDYFKARLISCKKSIFDHKGSLEEKETWEKFGYIITCQSSKWKAECTDFAQMKLIKGEQNKYYTLNKEFE